MEKEYPNGTSDLYTSKNIRRMSTLPWNYN